MSSFNHHLYFRKQRQSHRDASWQLRVEVFHRGFSCGVQRLFLDCCAAAEGGRCSTQGLEAVQNCQRQWAWLCHQLLLEELCRAGQDPLLKGQHGNSWLDWKAIFSSEGTSGGSNGRVWSYIPTKWLDLQRQWTHTVLLHFIRNYVFFCLWKLTSWPNCAW